MNGTPTAFDQSGRQPPPEIKVSRVVRPQTALNGNNGQATVDHHTSHSVQPVVPVAQSAQPVTPTPPIDAQVNNDATASSYRSVDQGGRPDGKLRLSAFASNNVDFLPTAALPSANNNAPAQIIRGQGERSGQPVPPASPVSLVPPSVPAPVPTYPVQQHGQREAYNRQPPNGAAQVNMQYATPPSQPSMIKPIRVHRVGQEPQIGDGHVVLHRSPNFYVRTTNRRGQRPNPLRKRTGHTTLVPTVMPDQERRTIASSTHLLPRIAPINPFPKAAFPVPLWLETLVVVIGLIAAFAAHAFNLFYFPHYELDEGTYMASAWAIVHGMIFPYPYGYGHPPAGWIQIAAWVQLTGGFFTFGNALDSGRVLMLLYAVASSLLVYLIIRRLLGSRSAALLALVIFSFSPLSIVYQRQIFLDNIGTFWLLLAIYLLVIGNSRLPYMVCSAIAFGLAMLSKEIFVLFIPIMIYTLWLHTTRFQRKFAFVAFTYTVIGMGSIFVLMALLKGELLPYGVLPWDHHPHLSMLDTYLTQAQRGQNEGSFSVSWNEWYGNDQVIMVCSVVTVLFNLIAGWWNRRLLLLALFAISFWILLVRGGVIFPFYFIPMIPLVAFNAAAAAHTVLHWFDRFKSLYLIRVICIFSILLAIIAYDARQISGYTTQLPAQPQINALAWIRNHIPRNAVLVINSYFYTDLHQEGGAGVGNGAIYPYANIYWNVAFDPELHDQLLNDDWQRIDYIVTDSSMLYDIQNRGGQMVLIEQALNNSVLRAEFQAQDRDQHIDIRIYQVIHTSASSITYRKAASNSSLIMPSFDGYTERENHRKTI